MNLSMPLTSACFSRSSTGRLAPGQVFGGGRFAFAFHLLGQFDQAIGRVGPAIEQHVFDVLQQLLGNLLVNGELAGVDDAHVHAGADRVIQKRRVHRLADDVVAAERKADVAHAAADFAAGADVV